MTPIDLQDQLAAELTEMFDGETYYAPSGELVPMNIYTQLLPIGEVDDEYDPAPYIIVRLVSGTDPGPTKDNSQTGDTGYEVDVVVIIVLWEETGDNQGHRILMGVINRIYGRYARNPLLKSREAVFDGKFKWTLQEDAYYPYCIAYCNLTFTIPAIRREDPFV